MDRKSDGKISVGIFRRRSKYDIQISLEILEDGVDGIQLSQKLAK